MVGPNKTPWLTDMMTKVCPGVPAIALNLLAGLPHCLVTSSVLTAPLVAGVRGGDFGRQLICIRQQGAEAVKSEPEAPLDDPSHLCSTGRAHV